MNALGWFPITTVFFLALFAFKAAYQWRHDRSNSGEAWSLYGIPGYVVSLGFVTVISIGLLLDYLGLPSFAGSRPYMGLLGLLLILDGLYARKFSGALVEAYRKRQEEMSRSPSFLARMFYRPINPGTHAAQIRAGGWIFTLFGLCISSAAVLRGPCPQSGARPDEAQPVAPIIPAGIKRADDFLRKVAKMYASEKSYSDRGVVVTTFFIKGHVFTQRRPFSTRFQRNRLFRYEFRDSSYLGNNLRYVVWSEGGEVLSWWTVEPRTERYRSIADALAGPSGISGGSSYNVPMLLLGNPAAMSLSAAKILGEQRLETGEVCYVIRGRYPPNSTSLGGGSTFRTLWIDKSSLALRRIADERSRLNEQADVEKTIVYEPVLDAPVDATSIHFDPPSAPRRWLDNLKCSLGSFGLLCPPADY